jgi:hypothetical protein
METHKNIYFTDQGLFLLTLAALAGALASEELPGVAAWKAREAVRAILKEIEAE